MFLGQAFQSKGEVDLLVARIFTLVWEQSDSQQWEGAPIIVLVWIVGILLGQFRWVDFARQPLHAMHLNFTYSPRDHISYYCNSWKRIMQNFVHLINPTCVTRHKAMHGNRTKTLPAFSLNQLIAAAHFLIKIPRNHVQIVHSEQ